MRGTESCGPHNYVLGSSFPLNPKQRRLLLTNSIKSLLSHSKSSLSLIESPLTLAGARALEFITAQRITRLQNICTTSQRRHGDVEGRIA
jgi:hypothetical protein